MSSIVDPAGWLLIVATIIVVVRWKAFAFDPKVRYIVLVAVLVRTAYSLANVLVGPVFGLSLDARAFHLEAVSFAQGNGVSVGLVNGWVYSAFVGGLYRVTRGGLLLGQQLSILAMVFVAATMIRIMRLLGVRESRIKWALAIVLFLPAGIVYTSGTLREAFQQLFFLLTVELAIRTINRPRLGTIALLGLVTLLGGSLHGAVAVAGAVVAVSAVFFAGIVRPPLGAGGSSAFRTMLPFGLAAVVLVGVSVPTLLVPYDLRGGTLSAASQYREGTPLARADYLRLPPGTTIDASDLPTVVGLYEVAPYPWQAETVADFVTAAEAIARTMLILIALLALVHSCRRTYRVFLQTLLVAGGWLAIEVVWSLGTTNWGTAARHHIVGFPLLVIVAALAPTLVARRPVAEPGARDHPLPLSLPSK